MLDYYKYGVGIRCMTYQQVNYILDTLDGFVLQQTDFPFTCMVMDDASTDGEVEVLRKYIAWQCVQEDSIETENDLYYRVSTRAKENNNCSFEFYFLKKNLYGTGKKQPIIQDWESQCKYLTLCEGDDYWTDPLKLQKQVDILEADESLMACCTNCSVVDMNSDVLEEKRVQPVVKENKQGRYSLRDFFDQGHQYPTLSVLYRNTHQDEVRQKTNAMRNPYMGDWTLWIALLCFGDMYYLDEVTCAYRINPTSLTHDQSKMNQRRLGQAKDNFRLIPLVASCLPDDYQDKKDDLINNTAWMWYRLAIAYKHVGQYFRMVYAFLRCELKDFGFVWRERNRK